MELVIFMGAQASGKSSFYQCRFFHSHVRVNLDMLKTRNRERTLFQACLVARQPIVVDNTNPTRADRKRYVEPILQRHASVQDISIVGYYFQSIAKDCLRRNGNRLKTQRVPEVAIRDTINRMEFPSLDEGFDKLNYVRITESEFEVEEWKNDV